MSKIRINVSHLVEEVTAYYLKSICSFMLAEHLEHKLFNRNSLILLLEVLEQYAKALRICIWSLFLFELMLPIWGPSI